MLHIYYSVSMDAFYKTWVWDHVMANDDGFSDVFSYTEFRNGWMAFKNLLDINYSDGFECPLCKTEPDIIIMDGVCLGMRKSMVPLLDYKGDDTGTNDILSGR